MVGMADPNLSPSGDTGTLFFLPDSAKMPFASHGAWCPFSPLLTSKMLGTPHPELGGQEAYGGHGVGLLVGVRVGGTGSHV